MDREPLLRNTSLNSYTIASQTFQNSLIKYDDLSLMKKKKREIIRLDREAVIPVIKHKLVQGLSQLIESSSDREDFLTFCKKVEYTIRAWYHVQFEEMMHLHTLFDPVHGTFKLEELNLSQEEIDELEQKFLEYLFKMMEKGNYKTVTNEEIETAASGKYCLNLQVEVDESKLDSSLLRRYFAKHPQENLPYFADQYIIFRRGFGMDRMTAYFFQWKIDTIISRVWQGFLRFTRLKRFFSRKRRLRHLRNYGKPEGTGSLDEHDGGSVGGDEEDLFVERIRIQNMKLSICNLFSKTTIQEPTFERMIIVYRLQSSKEEGRGIYVKHFKHIPMADMEIVLPEKKNPGLTPLDWVKFLVSAAIGLVTVITQLSKAKADLKVLIAVVSAVLGYIAKTYFTFQQNLMDYQSLITRSMYDKQLDSGKGTILHLCDDVIHQEVKEVIVSFFVLMQYGRFTRLDLDLKCEELIKEQFNERCNFDVDDAIDKLEKLGIVTKDQDERFSSVDVKAANEILGTTTEEVVTNANLGTRR